LRSFIRVALVALAVYGCAQARAVTVYAAGDVAECRSGPAASAAARVARMIPDDAIVLIAGDTTYPRADRATLESCYTPTWGRFLPHTYAVPGNHDYVHGSAQDFLDYFGERTPHRTWFRVRVADWWVIGLDSNISGEELNEQLRWLTQQLTEIEGDGHCVLAMWHHPLFSTGLHRGDGERMRPVWAALDDAGADLVLNGHEHFYEAFEPRDAAGRIHPSGLREIIAGTGGARLVDVSIARGAKAFARVHGILELDLQRDHYSYAFRTEKGVVKDSGGSRCRRAPAP
jgi:alkaline phosphatase